MKLFEDLPSTNVPIIAENLNQIKDNLVVVSPTEPIGNNREKIWMQNTDTEQKIYIKNDNDVYEEFIKKATEFKLVSRGDSTNFNDFTQNGFYQCNFQKGTNAPNAYATGILLVSGSYYISQLYIANLNGTTVVYARISQNKGTSWSNWVQLA